MNSFSVDCELLLMSRKILFYLERLVGHTGSGTGKIKKILTPTYHSSEIK